MEFKGTKGRLNITDNGNGQLALYGEDLRAIAFIPKLHPEYKAYIKLFKKSPEMLDMLKELLPVINSVEGHGETVKEIEQLIKEATKINGK